MWTDLERQLRELAGEYGQEHIFRYWDTLDTGARARFLEDLARIDFPLMRRLAETWILNAPEPERFSDIQPIPVIPAEPEDPAAVAAGEDALSRGEVGLFLVAGGQGTRLGFPGPKGCYPIGPLTGKTLFQYHAEKIRNLQRRYGCVLPWYIMVSETNEAATRAYFQENAWLGLAPDQVYFLRQRMVPCMDDHGRFLLEAADRLAMNPNGHGGCIPAMKEEGVIQDARDRGVRWLSYFQVDNWAVKVADPVFLGHHVLRNADMSSKVHRKNDPREAVGVHCLCDGDYRVIEYSELDLYPQLLETDEAGNLRFFAGNPAIHVISVDFVERLNAHYDEFPWHVAHKKVPCLDDTGALVKPDRPNAYKFETFVFDALKFVSHPPVALEIRREGEYTPTKQPEGVNSVAASRQSMANYWGGWLEKAGWTVPRDAGGHVAVPVEISPVFALTEREFLERAPEPRTVNSGVVIEADGSTSVN